MCGHQVSGQTRGQGGQMDNSQSPNIEQRAGPSFCSEEGRDTHCSRGGVLTNKRKQHNVTVETEEGEARWWRVSIQWLKITGCGHHRRRRVHCPELNKTIGIIFSFSTLIPGVAVCSVAHALWTCFPPWWLVRLKSGLKDYLKLHLFRTHKFSRWHDKILTWSTSINFQPLARLEIEQFYVNFIENFL